MAQGIDGGLVPAYAVLAANIFAVSAAFNFLKSAGDLVSLQAGQVAYASSTGVALRTLANDITEATDAQIGFQEASQAAAIGTAAGLSTDQLVRLGKAAKDTSLILGRDTTDSFNRLIRGVTKAEPELLDELGVILRLEEATEKYASALGKNAKELTAFERSQAVANDVLDQTERKYSKIIDIVNPTVNIYNQLGKTFDDILITIREFIAKGLTPLANAINEFPALGVAILGIFGKGVLTAALPGLRGIGDAAKQTARDAKKNYIAAAKSVRNYEKQVLSTSQKATQAQQNISKLKDPGFTGRGFEMLRTGQGDKLTSQQIVGMKSAINSTTKLGDAAKAKWIANLDVMLAKTKATTRGIDTTFQTMGSKFGLTVKRMQAVWAAGLAQMRAGIAAFTAFTAAALNALGWISLIATLGVVVYQFFQTKKEMSETEKEMQRVGERVQSLTEEYKHFNAVQQELLADGGDVATYFGNLGQRIGSLSVMSQRLLFDSGLEAYANNLTEITEKLNNAQAGVTKAGEGVAAAARAAAQYTDFSMPSAVTENVENFRKEDVEAATKALEELDTSFIGFLATSEDANLQSLGKYFQDLHKEVSTLNTNFGAAASDDFKDYFDDLNELATGNALTEERVRELTNSLLQNQVEVTKLGQSYRAFIKDNEDIDTAFLQIKNRLTAISQDQQTLDLITNQINRINELSIGDEAFEKQNRARLYQLVLQEDLLKRIIETDRRAKLAREALAVEKEVALLGETQLQSKFISLEFSIKENEIQRQLLESRRLILSNEILTGSLKGEALRQAELEQESLQNQVDLIDAQNVRLERQLSLTGQIADATNQSFETGLQRGLTAIFKGQESSLKDAVLGIARSMVESVAEVAAENLTRMITGSVTGVQIASSIAAGGATAATAISSAMIAAGSTVAAMLSASNMAAPVVSSIGSLIGIPAGNRLGLGRTGLNPNFTAAEKLGSMFGPGITATFANGGIMKGGFQSYANGGIINQPTVGLVGEGRFNEAVVPLPNGKAIPVDMKGSGGVTVNVAVNNNGSATTSVEGAQQQSANFGKAIAMAVQKEIQNQKRSGGMLSPYGAA